MGVGDSMSYLMARMAVDLIVGLAVVEGVFELALELVVR